MATSKVTREDAQEWLESLQQVGEGWYRQVALAVRANAHKALGMERREFAAQIGQRMIDPREAILELHKDGMSGREVADVLGISDNTVRRVLAEEGLITLPSAAVSGSSASQGAAVSGTAEEVEEDERIRELEDALADADAEVRGQKKRAADERKAFKKELADLKKEIVLLERQAEAADDEEDEQALQREKQAREAELSEMQRRMLARFAGGIADGVVAQIENAREQLAKLINDDVLTSGMVDRIGIAVRKLADELRVAEMAAKEDS